VLLSKVVVGVRKCGIKTVEVYSALQVDMQAGHVALWCCVVLGLAYEDGDGGRMSVAVGGHACRCREQ
jgi:hypothetical protein